MSLILLIFCWSLPLSKLSDSQNSNLEMSLFIPFIVGMLLICLLVRTPINKDERLILTKYFCSSSIFYASDVGRWCFLVVKVSGMLYLWAIIATHQDPYWAQPRIQTIQNCTLNVRLFLTFAWPQYSIITKKTFHLFGKDVRVSLSCLGIVTFPEE